MAINSLNNKIRILIVDNQPVFRAGLASILPADSFNICGAAGDYIEASAMVKKHRPDIVIMDIFTRNRGWNDFIADIKSLSPETRILIISMLDEEIYSEKAIKAGASGYLLKTSAADEISNALHAVFRKEIYLKSDVSSTILRRYIAGNTATGGGPEFLLSDRELEVFAHIGAGLSSKEIGAKIGVSTKTVDNHKAKIKDKMGYRNFIELAQAAVLWVRNRNQPSTN